MKIVAISDVHANLEALAALPESGDELWGLGDLVDYGANPRKVVTLLRSRADVAIRGNHDQAVGFEDEPRCTPCYRRMALETRDYTIQALNGDLTGYLQQLPLHRTVERDGKKFYVIARELEAASASSTAEDVRRCRLLRWILKLGTENRHGENPVA